MIPTTFAEFMDTLHPMDGDRWESRRCPDCGTPGVLIDKAGPLEEWACPVCDPEHGSPVIRDEVPS